METRLGKLNFENGYPTEETARKLFDEMDYERADINDMIIADNFADPKG